MLVEVFLQAHRDPPQEIVLDFDNTDIPLHGEQESGSSTTTTDITAPCRCTSSVASTAVRPLAAVQYRWRQGSVAEVERIVGQIRQAWPQVRIILRGDSGFCRDELLSWCEAHAVDYVVGLAQNPRLLRAIAAASEQAASQYQESGKRRGYLRSLSIRPKTVGHAPGR